MQIGATVGREWVSWALSYLVPGRAVPDYQQANGKFSCDRRHLSCPEYLGGVRIVIKHNPVTSWFILFMSIIESRKKTFIRDLSSLIGFFFSLVGSGRSRSFGLN